MSKAGIKNNTQKLIIIYKTNCILQRTIQFYIRNYKYNFYFYFNVPPQYPNFVCAKAPDSVTMVHWDFN